MISAKIDKIKQSGNNNQDMKNKTIILFLAFILMIQCSSGNREKLEFSRQGTINIIDNFKASHISSTPFKDLIDNFTRIEEDLNQQLTLFRDLSTSKQKVWGATTGSSILGNNEHTIPPDMEVFLKNDPLSFLGEHKNNSIHWKWIETSRDIDIKYDENYNKGFKCLILDEAESFDFDTIFPDAEIEFEIYARRNWHPVDLDLYIDDELIAKNAVGRNFRTFSIPIRPNPGTHKISLRSSLSEKIPKRKRTTPPRLLVFQIKIRSKNDVILFMVPASRQNEFSSSPLSVKYITDLDEKEDYNPFTNLYKIKNDFVLTGDGKSDNPNNIKKKLVLENLSLNALMSPPESRYEFVLDIPDDCFMEFGTGNFRYHDQEKTLPVMFKIFAELGTEQTLLYESVQEVKPELLRDQLSRNKVSLTDFAGKKIKLIFQTENISETETVAAQNLPLSFWENPIIYRTGQENDLKIILISLDTLRQDHLGSYGYARATSPNLDKLVKDSVIFNNVYAQSSWTLPSHMSMLFGLNSASHQVYYNNQKIDSSLPSVATFLKKAGFSTYAFTGGGYVSSIYGFAKGFDWYDEPVGGRKAPLGLNEAESLFTFTSDWLEKNKDKPFFLFLHTFQIHGPYVCPSPWNEMFLPENAAWDKLALRNFLDQNGEDYPFSPEERENIIALYDGEIRYTDEVLIKPLINRLKDLGIYDNTMLIITSDHGEEFQDHGGWLHGRNLYNELIKVPLIIKFPSSLNKGKIVDPKCSIIDLVPTILENAGIKYRKDMFDGASLNSLISGVEDSDRIFISDLAHKDIPDPCPAIIATNKNQLKFIFTKSKDGIKRVEAYDLQRDAREKHNVFRKADKLRAEVYKYLEEYYQLKSKVKRSQQNIRMDKELEEKLKALGYLR